MTISLSAKRRERLDNITRVIDVAVGVVSMVAGVFAAIAPPPTIIREVSIPALIVLWVVFLTLGGFGAALGRLTGIWIFETTGIVLMATGAAIYLAVVSTSIVRELGVAVACALILIALLSIGRRYVQLQMFLSEPGEESFIDRLRKLFRVSTTAALRD